MITNERQYRITKSQAERFEGALDQMSTAPAPDSEIHPIIWEAQRNAMTSQLSDLQGELLEYETLRSGKRRAWMLHSFEELPEALIQARIVSGMSQKELADQLGLKEQQLQRYESSSYSGASWTRLCEVMRALGVSLRGDFAVAAPTTSPHAFVRRLNAAGVDEEFLFRRLLPATLSNEIHFLIHSAPDAKKSSHQDWLQFTSPMRSPQDVLHDASSHLAPIFGCREEDLLSPSHALQFDISQAGSPRFKLKKRANAPRVTAYTLYAHYLALLVLQATADLPRMPLPKSSKEVWQGIVQQGGEVNLQTTLDYVWSLGIPVLPLVGSGGFHGACWRVQGRNIIALKQNTTSLAAWLQDLLHELWHGMQEPEAPSLSVLEEEPTSEERLASPEERSANSFAANVGLNGLGDQLIEICIDRAKGRIPALKQAVLQVANEHNAPVDRLANYLAYRISIDPDLVGENWWGTAATLQTQANPWKSACDVLLRHLNWQTLSSHDSSLLQRAFEPLVEL